MANIGLYPYQGTPAYYVLNAAPPGTMNALQNTTTEEDITPTFIQATEGQAGATETQPTAEVVWQDLSGSMGLYKQSAAPGDLTRCFVSDADTTRPNQITAWLQWPSGASVVVDAFPNTNPPWHLAGIIEGATGWGFLAYDQTLSEAGIWMWNGTKFAFQRLAATIPTNQTSSRLPVNTGIYQAAFYPFPVVPQTDNSAWYPYGSALGCSDAFAAPVAPVGVVNAVHTFVYFDILFVIASTGGNLTITPYRPRVPNSANILQSVTYSGLANCLGTITGETCCLGVAVCEGAAYIVTDHTCYAMQWNDNNNTILITKLFELPRFTAAPVAWNGEIYIGADNRIAHITPGQRGFDWRIIDGFGVMPQPYAGIIVQLIPSPDALFAQLAGNPSGSCLLRMDTNGAWSCAHLDATNQFPSMIVPVVDGTNPFGLAFLNATAGTGATVLPFPQAGRNPRTLAVSQRHQQTGPFRTITPWFDLASETAQKILERIREAALNSFNLPILIHYQTDYADEQGADTFTSGAAKGTGTWHPCGEIIANMTAPSACFAGSTDAGGTGSVWFEFDGATAYANIGTLAAYPTYRQVRFCITVQGDSSGNTVPTHVSLGFHRLEFVTKGYERTIQLRIYVGEDQGTAQQPASTVTYANNAAVQTAKNRLRAAVSAKAIQTFVDEWAVASPVVITKYRADLAGVDANGEPNGYLITLTLQYVQLVGQN